MRIGIVSDTHGQTAFALEAVRMLDSLDVQQVIHCGDIGSTQIIPLFAAWPTHFVFGNVDYDPAELEAAIIASGQTCHRRFGSLELAGVKIAFLHSDDSRLFDEQINSGDWDLICYGHTHVADVRKHGDTLLLNPGALHRASPHTLAIVDLPQLDVQHIAL